MKQLSVNYPTINPKILLFWVLAAFTTLASGQNLYITNPQSWGAYPGNITDYTISVRPKGVFLEVGLYLTFSNTKDGSWRPSDSLEIVYDFNLPDNASIVDSWLWVGDDIVQALILDRWTATAIYEGIVQRRRDPSLLYRLYNNTYRLQIYPLIPGESRKVKITYLVPANLDGEYIQTSIPNYLAYVSQEPLKNIQVQVWNNSQVTGPTWVNPEGKKMFEPAKHDQLGNYWKTELPTFSTSSEVSLTKVNKGVLFGATSYKGENYYQLALQPGAAMEIAGANKKSLIVINYDYTETSFNIPNQFADRIREQVLNNLSPQDSFNVMLSTLQIKPYFDRWQVASVENINKAMDELFKKIQYTIPNLPGVLDQGIGWLKSHGNDGSLLLITSSDQFKSLDAINKFLDVLLRTYDPLPPLYILDFGDLHPDGFSIPGGQFILANRYLYRLLADKSNGVNIATNSYSFNTDLRELFLSMDARFSAFDIYTKPQNGFSYNRKAVSATNDAKNIYPNSWVIQLGNYTGELPMDVDLAGFFKGEPIFKSLELDNTDLMLSDSMLATYLVAQEISELESRVGGINSVNGSANTEIVREIIEKSLKWRVLSEFTAFLALEPGMLNQERCTTCRDESTPTTNTQSGIATNFFAEAYPNPFREKITFKVNIPQSALQKQIRLSITDALGREVHHFESQASQAGKWEYVWDAKGDQGKVVSAGIYFVNIEIASLRSALRIVKI